MKIYLKYFLILNLFSISFIVYGQKDGKNSVINTRIGLSPIIGLYSLNKNHALDAKQKMAFCISLKEEIKLSRDNRNFLFVGAEYMLHGLSFKSYFFYADSLQLYTADRKRFKYDLTIHEIDFPIQIKHSFVNETNSVFSSYIFGGYCYRWLVASYLKVSENGNNIINRTEHLTFKIPAFTPVNNSFFNVGIGFQQNKLVKHKSVFAELQFKYALSPMQISESFAPSSLYINGHFFYITVGFKL